MGGQAPNLGIQLRQLLFMGGFERRDRVPLLKHIGQPGDGGQFPLPQHRRCHPMLGRELIEGLGFLQQLQHDLGLETRGVRLFHNPIVRNPGHWCVSILGSTIHIRRRARVKGPQQRARHNNWAFGQLRKFISYKAQLVGVPVYLVDPKYTSQRCSACGHTERRNRRNRAEFCCVACGHASPADYNAALNIEWAARQPTYGVQPSG